MACFVPFYVTCSGCGKRSRPHPSPRQGLRLVLLGKFANCPGCGKPLTIGLADRPMLRELLACLKREGLSVAPNVRLPDSLPEDLLISQPDFQAA